MTRSFFFFWIFFDFLISHLALSNTRSIHLSYMDFISVCGLHRDENKHKIISYAPRNHSQHSLGNSACSFWLDRSSCVSTLRAPDDRGILLHRGNAPLPTLGLHLSNMQPVLSHWKPRRHYSFSKRIFITDDILIAKSLGIDEWELEEIVRLPGLREHTLYDIERDIERLFPFS